MADDDGYKVGKGRPPREHQFQKGRSGNPGGRPKSPVKEATDETIYEKLMNQHVRVTIDGKQKLISRREALIHQLIMGALKGNAKLMEVVVRTEGKYGALREPPPKIEGGGVLVVSETMSEQDWYARFGGQQPRQPFPALDILRLELSEGDDEKND